MLPCINFHLCHHSCFVMSLLSDDRGGWENRLTGIRKNRTSYLLVIKILLCWGHPLMNIHMETYIFLFFLSIQTCLSRYLFHSFLCHNFSNHVSSKPLTIPVNNWWQPMYWYVIACLAISPSKQSVQPDPLPKVLPTENISFHLCPSGIS